MGEKGPGVARCSHGKRTLLAVWKVAWRTREEDRGRQWGDRATENAHGEKRDKGSGSSLAGRSGRRQSDLCQAVRAPDLCAPDFCFPPPSSRTAGLAHPGAG